MSGTIWHRDRADRFWARLTSLIQEYPEIMEHMIRNYNTDPTEDMWAGGDGWPDFNKDDPTYVSGLVLVVKISNTEGFEAVWMGDPPTQSAYLTDGLLQAATTMT